MFATQPLQNIPTLSESTSAFLLYAQVELGFAEQSLLKYRDCLRQVARILSDHAVTSYAKEDVRLLKSNLQNRRLSVHRQVSILLSLKRLLQFCRDERGLDVLDPSLITVPKRPRRDVQYLTPEEIEAFIGVISLLDSHGRMSIFGLRFRALVEVLLGTGMRIGEVLSLDREDIDWSRREAKIIGKGNRQRTVFFTNRALLWLERYLAARQDDDPSVFVNQRGGGRLKRTDIWRPFSRYRKKAGLKKRITPHWLRHTAATQLLFNGCPIGHIKEILGHARLETTCRYYLGLDHAAAKEAHQRFLVYPGAAETEAVVPVSNRTSDNASVHF